MVAAAGASCFRVSGRLGNGLVLAPIISAIDPDEAREKFAALGGYAEREHDPWAGLADELSVTLLHGPDQHAWPGPAAATE